jgi:hypothetical protein
VKFSFVYSVKLAVKCTLICPKPNSIRLYVLGP